LVLGRSGKIRSDISSISPQNFTGAGQKVRNFCLDFRQQLPSTHCGFDFETEQDIGNLTLPLSAPMTVLRIEADNSPTPSRIFIWGRIGQNLI